MSNRKEIRKPYDVLIRTTKTASEANPNQLFVFVKHYEEFGEDAPINIKLVRNKYVQIGQVLPQNANDVDKCYMVIAR